MTKRNPRAVRRLLASGFTLLELLIVVVIIGILAAFAVPSYKKSIETTKADDAVALVNMIGTTNRMFALDHSGSYVVGAFPTPPSTSCGPGACPAVPSGSNGCELVWCKYLADQNFGSKPYTFRACDGAGGGCRNNAAAGAVRLNGSGVYRNWEYSQDKAGVITLYGGAPAPTY